MLEYLWHCFRLIFDILIGLLVWSTVVSVIGSLWYLTSLIWEKKSMEKEVSKWQSKE